MRSSCMTPQSLLSGRRTGIRQSASGTCAVRCTSSSSRRGKSVTGHGTKNPQGLPATRCDRRRLPLLTWSGFPTATPDPSTSAGRVPCQSLDKIASVKGDITWKSAVSGVLSRLPIEFTLDDVNRYRDELGALFPQNRHVEPKIRQTLQILRDRGTLEFLGGGHYRKRGSSSHFSCLIDTSLAKNYKSRSQIARAIIEPWAEYNLYCLECPSDDISALPNNTKVADLRCPKCETTYQIKSSNGRFGTRVHGADYRSYLLAAETKSFPNLLLVEWDSRFSCVFVVRAIQGAAISADRIVPRNPLSDRARRARWRGCTIDVSGLSTTELVVPELRDPEDCRADWRAQRE